MNVLIDGKKSDVEMGKKDDLQTFIDSLKDSLKDTNRVIKRITIDGVVLSHDTEGSFKKKKMSSAGKVQVTTDVPLSLAIETLALAEEYLKNCQAHVDKFSLLLQTGAEEENYDSFVESLRGWGTVVKLVDITREMLSLDFKTVTVQGRTIAEFNAGLQKVLGQTKQALQDEDIVMLQDLLRYELVPCIEQMRGVVHEVGLIAASRKGE